MLLHTHTTLYFIAMPTLLYFTVLYYATLYDFFCYKLYTIAAINNNPVDKKWLDLTHPLHTMHQAPTKVTRIDRNPPSAPLPRKPDLRSFSQIRSSAHLMSK